LGVPPQRHVDRHPEQQRRGSFWGVFWEALFGLVFCDPDRAPATDSNLGHLLGIIERAGQDERFRARVRRTLRSVTSALGIFALNWNTDVLINQLFLKPDAYVRVGYRPNRSLTCSQSWAACPRTTWNHPIRVVRGSARRGRLATMSRAGKRNKKKKDSGLEHDQEQGRGVAALSRRPNASRNASKTVGSLEAERYGPGIPLALVRLLARA
jgi:Protein of unknown function (DUF1269)